MREAKRPDSRLCTGWCGRNDTLRSRCSSALSSSRSAYTPRIRLRASTIPPSRRCNQRGDLVDHLVGGNALRHRLVAQDEPVTQAIVHDSPDMIRCHELTRIEPCTRACAAIEREAAARAGTDLDP